MSENILPTEVKVSHRKGFIHYVDNPVLIQAVSDSLTSYGVEKEQITIDYDSIDFIESLREGDIVIVDSLYDLMSSRFSMSEVLCKILDHHASLVSIRDNIQIGMDNDQFIHFLNIMKKYRQIFSSKPGLGSDADGVQFTLRKKGRPRGRIAEYQLDKYRNALSLYQEGLSMQEATRQSGCNYSSFWYWYNKNNKQIG
ncbi:MAG: hypothetical protein MJY60_04325 [Bacteroidales bacterium]|nr:hypothetical protein [Bacteroidales bacterium]